MGQAFSGLQLEVYTGSTSARHSQPRNVERHRCDGRIEDMCRALAAGWGEMRETAPTAWNNLLECYTAEEG
jgi:hypothetical protein